jgi:hypothetical protein
MSDARSKVESWVKGFTSSVRADTTQSDGMEDFSLKAKKPRTKKKEDYRDVVSYLYECMDPCSMGGRKKSMKHWRRLACQRLGITKMGAKKWDAIVACGVEHDVFHVEQCGSGRNAYSTLVPNEEPFDEEAPPTPSVRVAEEDDDEGLPELPDGPIGPSTLPCGHMGWGSDSEHKEAQEAGKCCANWRSQPEWRIRGLKEPVPVGFRRSKEREGSLGWPGLCCDPNTGLYIGGLANDCRHYHDGPERCVVHGGGIDSKREP